MSIFVRLYFISILVNAKLDISHDNYDLEADKNIALNTTKQHVLETTGMEFERCVHAFVLSVVQNQAYFWFLTQCDYFSISD